MLPGESAGETSPCVSRNSPLLMRSLPGLILFASFILPFGAAAAPDAGADPVRTKSTPCPVSGTAQVAFQAAISPSSFRTVDGREIRLAGVIGRSEDGEKLSPAEIVATRN